ncbi:MAG TPA: hypothetical protein VJ864_14220 [Candidatus Binatia bacterium]|nr:hypothetical protein [Candidatus Binatia bacterium]
MLTVFADTNWLDYPGFELWRFVNLFLFIAGALYVHRRFGNFVTERLRSRRATIKRELQESRLRRKTAEAELEKVEAKLQELDTQVSRIRSEAQAEATAERERIKNATAIEMAKLRSHGEREIEKIAKGAQLELRQFTAAESIRMAEGLIRRDLDSREDSRLISTSARHFGGAQR